jgi:hypothetical protein
VPAAPLERRAALDDEHIRVGEELDGLEGALLDREHAKREVEFAALDEVKELEVGGRFAQVYLEP